LPINFLNSLGIPIHDPHIADRARWEGWEEGLFKPDRGNGGFGIQACLFFADLSRMGLLQFHFPGETR
jgi:hypothetical protein